MPIQNVMLVAGFNYENAKNPVFLERCTNRMARMLNSRSTSGELVFTLFDVGGGLIRQSSVDPKTKNRSWIELSRFTPVTTANYSSFVTGQENEFDQNSLGTMSITNVYDFVKDIGAGPNKGTLLELSFFSHGWSGGPILVNSFESKAQTTGRDPADKDARLWKDFVTPYMDATELAKFRAAFAATGIVWTWGCAFYRPANIILSRLFKTSKYSSTPPSAIKDTDKFTLNFSEDTTKPRGKADFDDIVNDLLPGGKLSGRSYSITATFRTIKNAFKTLVADTYSTQVAAATGAKTFGALPGTSADYEKSVRLPLMVIPTRKPPYDDNFTPNLKFYKTHLGVQIDPENRGYGAF
jgi:hypothetical protein